MGKKLADLLRAPVDLGAVDPRSTPGFKGSKADARAHQPELAGRIATLQEQLIAEGRSGGSRSALLVLQGMDTSGKGGTVKHVVGQVDPAGVHVVAFRRPTPAELRHDFLWRVRRELPRPGMLGVFDRSHYEDVLVVRVNELVPREVWEPRYDEINAFEREVVDSGTVIVKVMLHVSQEEQKARLRERLERPDKYWKFNPKDVDERAKWPAYQEAYQAVLDRTSTEHAPWHVVPADSKWYARLAVGALVLAAVESLDLDWPPADFDVEAEKARLDAQPF
jgi:PPK2 family polyphosphate:nucleotide phosphotransferase